MAFQLYFISIIGTLLKIKYLWLRRVFFRNGWLLKDFNQTYISFIPKKSGACNFNQFRPIGLCNVCYKVISKILVNRLRLLLDKMVDPA